MRMIPQMSQHESPPLLLLKTVENLENAVFVRFSYYRISLLIFGTQNELVLVWWDVDAVQGVFKLEILWGYQNNVVPW